MNPFRFFCCEKGDKLRDIAWFVERVIFKNVMAMLRDGEVIIT